VLYQPTSTVQIEFSLQKSTQPNRVLSTDFAFSAFWREQKSARFSNARSGARNERGFVG